MSESIQMPALPPLEVLLPCGLAAIVAAFVLAACFGPVLAVVSEKLAAARKRGFYAKAAQQTAQMSLFFGLLAAGLLVAGLVRIGAEEPAVFRFPYRLPLAVTGGTIALAALILALYVFLRPKKGPSTAVHAAIGLAGAALSLMGLFLCAGMIRRFLHAPPDISPEIPLHEGLVQFFLIPSDSFFWPLLLESIPLGFAFAASFATVWLVIVRGRQDYGRDYYAFALPYFSGWALLATLPAIPAGAYAVLRGRELMLPELSHLPSPLLDVLSAALPLLACLLWLTVIRSAFPMRRKISVFLAWLFLLAGFGGQVLMLNTIIPSP